MSSIYRYSSDADGGFGVRGDCGFPATVNNGKFYAPPGGIHTPEQLPRDGQRAFGGGRSGGRNLVAGKETSYT